jgi:hypothetical protein
MAQPRRFDHDEAKRLYADGWPLPRLAQRYGVSYNAVWELCVPGARERKTEAMRRRYRQPCPGGCGRLVWTNIKGRSGLCPRCADAARATTARTGELLCARCGEWKQDEAFPHRHAAIVRRGRATECRPCQTASRRERRHKAAA